MASSPIQPSNYTFPVNWPMLTPRRRSFRRPLSSPAQHPPKSAFGNKLHPGTTTITRFKDDSHGGMAPASPRLVVRLRVGHLDVTVGKIAPKHRSPPRQIKTTSTVAVDKFAPNRQRDHSSPPQEIVGFEKPYKKSSPTAAFSVCRPEIADETRTKQKQHQGEKEKDEVKKRRFSLLLLTEEQIAQDILAAKKLAAGRSLSDGNNNNKRRKSSSRKGRQGFSFSVSKEEAEQDLGTDTGEKRLRPKHGHLIPALKLSFY